LQCIGSHTELIFDGGSLVYDINGRQVKEMKYFEEDFQLFELDQLLKKDDSIKHPPEKNIFIPQKK
jgi:NAD+ synthase (glutamine-hydrolysing)